MRLDSRHISGMALAGLLLALVSGPVGQDRPAAQAQAGSSQPATGVTLTLYDNVISWTTLPAVAVRAEVRSGTTLKAVGQAQSGQDGRVNLNLQGAGGGGGGGGGGGQNPNLRAGDSITLLPTGGMTATLTVPSLSVAASAADNKVMGTAVAGAGLSVSLSHGGQAQNAAATADGAGAYSASFGDVAPGDTGLVSLVKDGNTFQAEFAAFQASFSLGSRQVTGVATPGETVVITLTAADGTTAKGTRTVTVQGGGTEFNTGGGGGGGPGGGGGNAFGPVVPGDSAKVEVTSPVAGANLSLTAQAPNIVVGTNPSTQTVSGQAPGGATVEVVALSPEGTSYSSTTTAGPADPGTGLGAFSTTVSGATGMGPGWRIYAYASSTPGLRFRAADALEQVRIGIHANQVGGVADPGRPITVTILSSAGEARGSQTTQANNNAQFNISFNGGGGGGPGGGMPTQPVDFNTGDRVQVEFSVGDPLIIPIPNITARTDATADTVSGEGPAGAQVWATQGNGQGMVTVRTAVDAGGAYSLSFAGSRDLAAPMGGAVNFRLPSGHELYSNWGVVQMTVELGNFQVQGSGASNREVTASLVDQNGRTTVGAADDQSGGGGGGGGPGGGGGLNGAGQWGFLFRDTLGQPVRMQPGDKVRVTVGDDTVELTLPPLSGVAFVGDDLINGSTTAGRAVTVQVTHVLIQGNARQDVTADASGNFSLDLTGTFDVQHNDNILFTTNEGIHIVNSRMTVPGLRLNLDEARLTGSWKPDTLLEVGLVSGPAADTVFSGQVRTQANATFAIVFQKGDSRVLPKTGDNVVVSDPATREKIVLKVPELTVAGDAQTEAFSGRAVPGGSLTLQASNAFPRPGGGGGPGGGGPGGGGGNRFGQPTINPDGTWTLTFNQPAYNIRPGTRMFTLYREPGGHLIERLRYLPIASVQHGGGAVCGYAEPRANLSSTLVDAGGQTLGSATGQGDYNSSFELLMRDGQDKVVRSAAGQTAKVKLGADTVDVPLADVSIEVVWGQGLLRGTAPSGSTLLLRRPADTCLAAAGGPGGGGGGPGGGNGTIQVPENGQFQLPAAFNMDPGDGIEVAWYAPNDHRVYRHIFRALGQVYVGTDKVGGRATPNSPVIVTLLNGTTERGKAEVQTDAEGRFLAVFKGPDGKPILIQAGDTVKVEGSGESPQIAVEPLAFDWSPGDVIALEAAPNKTVQISLAIKDQADVTFPITTDAGGKWRFTATDIPPRAGFTLADIEGVRAVIETPNEHQIIFEAGVLPNTPVEPPVRAPKIYLPALKKATR